MLDFGASNRMIQAHLATREISGRKSSTADVLSPAASGVHYEAGRFRNSESASPIAGRTIASLMWGLLTRRRSGRPHGPIPMERMRATADPRSGTLAATWLGHASVLLEVDGRRLLADPMFSFRASPTQVLGPHRLHPNPIPLSDLLPVDAVLISHDHYDHLDRATVHALAARTEAVFLVPLGVGAHLREWDVPQDRVVELGWDEQHRIGELTVACTEARHFSGRSLGRDGTLWSSWAILGPTSSAFFGGDTGYTAAFTEIADRHGPFDLTILPIGAYDAAWPDIHMDPEQAMQAHRDLRGGALLPIHWATFNLALHPWAEPIERLLAAATPEDTVLLTPPGRRVTLPSGQAPDDQGGKRWWMTEAG